jgi:hypothetical protein
VITVSDCRAPIVPWTPALTLSLIIGVGLFPGCSTQAERAQSDLDTLSSALPGIYHDEPSAPGAVAGASGGSGAPARAGSAPTVTLSIARVHVQLVGDVVYFVRESAASNERLVYAQRIWTLALNRQGELVQHMFLFKDPRRWIGASEHPELLLSLLPDDLAPLQGCELIWRKTPQGFQASSAHADCQPGNAAQGQSIERGAKLEGTELALAERQIGADGALLPASGPAFTLVLRRGCGTAPTAGSTH